MPHPSNLMHLCLDMILHRQGIFTTCQYIAKLLVVLRRQELLELGDKIGHVSTRLKEEEIIGSLRKVKHSFFDALKRHFATEIDGICSICQEEYEANDEIGELNCGHSYHVFCIKQWLL